MMVSMMARRYAMRIGISFMMIALIVGVAGCPLPSIPDPGRSRDLEIITWHDLDAVRHNRAGHHRLMNDLDATTSGYSGLAGPAANRGKGWQPIGWFIGSLDGQGYEIRDLTINRPGEIQIGLFSVSSSEAIIENVGLANVDVIGFRYVGALVGRSYGIVRNSYSVGSVTGTDWSVGGLVGDNCGTMIDCYFSGDVSGSRGVGGLVGDNWAGTVSRCYAIGSVNGDERVGGLAGSNRGTVDASHATGAVTGTQDVGGLVGQNSRVVINSYSASSATGEWWVGGLVGHNTGTVNHSHSNGTVTGELAVGGLIGGTESEAIVSDSFWDSQTSGQSSSRGGIGKTTAEMMDIGTFTDTETEGLDEPWDMVAVAPGESDGDHIWNIVDGETYPFLSWQDV